MCDSDDYFPHLKPAEDLNGPWSDCCCQGRPTYNHYRFTAREPTLTALTVKSSQVESWCQDLSTSESQSVAKDKGQREAISQTLMKVR